MVLGVFLFSCSEVNEKTMLVSGSVNGLKKGTLFLKQIKDSVLTTLDSVEIRKDASFQFSQQVESPEVFYLYLDKEDNNSINDIITFFGEPGEISVQTTWNGFDSDYEIQGSKSQEEYAELKTILSDFNTRHFEIAQTFNSLDPQKDSLALDSLSRLSERNLIGRYRYILNFGLTHANSHVTPYVLLTEAKEANPVYLDSIYNSLSEDVAQSKYGAELKRFLDSQ